MKDVPVKFRGRFWLKDDYVEVAPKDGEIIYGGYTRMKFLDDDGEGDYIINENGLALLVYPNSVAQLIGYDAAGNEVYEDDKLIRGSHEYIAGIRPVSYTDDKKYYKPEKDFSRFLLKENKKND